MEDLFSFDRLLIVPSDHSLRIYDPQTGKQSTNWHALLARRNRLTISPDGKTIATYGDSGDLVLWDAGTGEPIGKPLPPEQPGKPLAVVAFSSAGDRIATGASNGTVRMWNAKTGELLWMERAFSMVAEHLQFSPDDAFLAAANLGKKLCTFDAQSGRMAAEPLDFVSQQRSADWTDVPGHMLTLGTDGIARLWSLETRLRTWRNPRVADPRLLAISADRRVLATVEPEKGLSLFRSLPDGSFDSNGSQAIVTGEGSLDAIALADDGSRVALSKQRQVTVWDTHNHERVAGPWLHGDWVSLMRFTPDGANLICITHAGTATVWHLSPAHQLYEPLNVSSPIDIDFDRAAARCAVAAASGVTIWDLATGGRLRPGFLGDRGLCFARFANDPNRVLIGRGKQTQVWDVVTAQPRQVFTSPSSLRCVDVSADKAQILTGDADGTARLWRSVDGAPASPPFEHSSALSGVSIDPKGHFILTLTDASRACLWSAGSAELVWTVSVPRVECWSKSSQNSTSPDLHKIRLAFFASDRSSVHILTQLGTVVTIGLHADDRPEKQIADDVTIRTGVEIDQVGGLRTLEPAELATRWKAAGRSVGALNTGATRIDRSGALNHRPALTASATVHDRFDWWLH